MVKFNKHNVTNTRTKAKARIFYSLDNRTDGRKCVSLYAKDYRNDTDTMTDYFDQGRVVLFENHPLYTEARKAAVGIYSYGRIALLIVSH